MQTISEFFEKSYSAIISPKYALNFLIEELLSSKTIKWKKNENLVQLKQGHSGAKVN